MSDDVDVQQATSSPAEVRSIDELLKDAQAKISEISESVGKMQAASTAAAETQKQLQVLFADAQAKMTEIASIATQAVAAKTKITDEQAVIAKKSEHIQNAQEHADAVRVNLDKALTAANQQATATEGESSRAKTAADNIATVLTEVQKKKASVDADASAIDASRKKAEESTASIKGLAEKATTIEDRIADYEKRLAELYEQCTIQLKNITDLLPGATSAGLAHAFDDRRKTFLKPHNRWQILFVGSVLAIIAVAVTGLWSFNHVDVVSGTAAAGAVTTASPKDLTWDEVLRMWLLRLPIIGALVWLALHASREAALAKRLEEDYGYKVAVASSFLGFHKQLVEVGAAAGTNKPLAKLCEDTLTTIASPPGRIYASHKLTITPADQMTDAAKGAVELANAATKGQK